MYKSKRGITLKDGEYYWVRETNHGVTFDPEVAMWDEDEHCFSTMGSSVQLLKYGGVVEVLQHIPIPVEL